MAADEKVRCLMCGLTDYAERVTCSLCLRDPKALNMDVERLPLLREVPGVDWLCIPPIGK